MLGLQVGQEREEVAAAVHSLSSRRVPRAQGFLLCLLAFPLVTHRLAQGSGPQTSESPGGLTGVNLGISLLMSLSYSHIICLANKF